MQFARDVDADCGCRCFAPRLPHLFLCSCHLRLPPLCTASGATFANVYEKAVFSRVDGSAGVAFGSIPRVLSYPGILSER